jgi:GDP-L-fucose synthase
MPTNLYGPGDNYHLENGHVVPTLLRRFYEAQQARAPEVVMWGTGKPKREFLFVEDLAEACLFLLRYYDGAIPINIGSEEEVTVRELAESIAEVVGFRGDIKHDLTKPDGTPRKKSDTRRLSEMGWSARTPLQSGLKRTFEDFIAHAGQWRQN